MKITNLSENNSLFNVFLSELRDVTIQKDALRFRKNLERIGEIFAYEISKELSYNEKDISSPLGIKKTALPDEQPVIASILRAGLPLHNGFLNFFDQGENCFISAFRKYTSKNEFEIIYEYIASPSLENKTVILCDPMLATGASFEVGYRALLEKGNPKHIHMVAVIASQAGVDYVNKHIKNENCSLWLGDIDPVLNEKAYIVPGLGDAGDLAFGNKL